VHARELLELTRLSGADKIAHGHGGNEDATRLQSPEQSCVSNASTDGQVDLQLALQSRRSWDVTSSFCRRI